MISSKQAAINAFAKDLVKGVHGPFLGTANELSRTGYYSQLHPLTKMKIQSTPKTTRICRTCRGTRITGIEHHNGIVTIKKCGFCKGRGEVYG